VIEGSLKNRTLEFSHLTVMCVCPWSVMSRTVIARGMTVGDVKSDSEFLCINATALPDIFLILRIHTLLLIQKAILYHTHNHVTMKPTLFLLTTLSALVAAVPVHASNPPPPLPTAFYPDPVSNSGSGQMADNMLPDSDLPGGGIGSSSPQISDKRALANAVPDKYDSSTYYDAAAEKEAEELALVLDAASENAAEDESADTNLSVKRGQGMEGKSVEGCKKRAEPAACVKCQKEWDMYVRFPIILQSLQSSCGFGVELDANGLM